MTGDEKARLARLIGDARALLADPGRGYDAATGYASRCGLLETHLELVCESAEAFTPYTGSDQ